MSEKELKSKSKSEAEIYEAATEESATVGCPSLVPWKLPGGFDGAAPGEKKAKAEVDVEELKQRGAKLKACNERMRERIVEIAHLANECLLNTNHPNGYEPGQYGRDYMTYGKAIAQIRRTCKESMVEECVPDYEWLAKIMTRENFDPDRLAKAIEAEAAQRDEARQKRKIHWASYTTKVDVTAMGKTGQNSKVYEVRVDKRSEPGEYTCATCRVNGKRVMDVKFTGSAWMLKRILTAGMQGLVNYKALRSRNKRRREREGRA